MPEKPIYEYAIIRVVPKVEREEFLNVGVIVFCKATGFLKVRYEVEETRLNAFSQAIDVGQLRRYLNSWKLICQGNKQGGRIAQLDTPGRFRWLTATRSTIIQCSQVHPGRCENPDKLLDRLFDTYVL